jgi:TPR repeat protein
LYFKDGYGTNKDKARALSYFQLAAHGGHLHAIFNLGEMNADGKVVKRNCNFAVEVIKYCRGLNFTVAHNHICVDTRMLQE